MNITRFGHACLLVEENGVRILIDPGNWSQLPPLSGVDGILITHEHQDHIDIAKVKELLGTNPDAKIVTHAAVGKLLDAEGIAYETIEEGGTATIKGLSIESFGSEHAVIYGSSPCRNTGFLIAEKLFVPGDSLHDVPNKPVEILALPTGGPWMKLSDAIDYAKAVKPRVAFPIHDAMYTDVYKETLIPFAIGTNLEAAGIEFRNVGATSTEEF